MTIFLKFLECLWHSLLRNDFAMEQSYRDFVSLEEQKQKRKLEKLRRVNVRANLTPSIVMRSGYSPIHNSNGTSRFAEPVPMAIVHLNQVISGHRSPNRESYLHPLFYRCRNKVQVVATAQYYLDLLNEDTIDTRALVIWCASRIHDVEKETTDVDRCTLSIYVETYSKPNREILNSWEITLDELKYVAILGKPKFNPDFFELCKTPMDYHYTALWYMQNDTFQPTPKTKTDAPPLSYYY